MLESGFQVRSEPTYFGVDAREAVLLYQGQEQALDEVVGVLWAVAPVASVKIQRHPIDLTEFIKRLACGDFVGPTRRQDEGPTGRRKSFPVRFRVLDRPHASPGILGDQKDI